MKKVIFVIIAIILVSCVSTTKIKEYELGQGVIIKKNIVPYTTNHGRIQDTLYFAYIFTDKNGEVIKSMIDSEDFHNNLKESDTINVIFDSKGDYIDRTFYSTLYKLDLIGTKEDSIYYYSPKFANTFRFSKNTVKEHKTFLIY